ncbi:MAG: hypothetical protein WKI04_17795 [Ferruginibacter sp.]
MYFNGGTAASTTISLTGSIAPNGVFVLAQSLASFATSSFLNQTSGGSWYNGDDAIVLRKGGPTGTIVDIIGQVGFDPGTEWGTGLTSTADNTIRRKTGICTGDVIATDAFDPAVEWDGFAIDNFSGLGSHTSICSTTGQSITISPVSLSFTTTVNTPSAFQSYTVQGNLLDNDINITIPALSSFRISSTDAGPYTTTITITAAAANPSRAGYVIFSPTCRPIR